jgi:hypothetical protein
LAGNFESIGPFALGRTDQLVAASLISFSLGSRLTRAWSWVILVAAVGTAVVLTFADDWWGVGAALSFAAFVFVGAPLLRSNNGNRQIRLSASAEGLVVETADVRATYKWSALGSVRYFRRRLFIMISGKCALVIPERATTRSNLEVLEQLVSRHRNDFYRKPETA